MTAEYLRHIQIDFIGNLRDLGGYPARDGRTVAWRKLFRSGEPKHQDSNDVSLLKQETGICSVIDLRGKAECSPERIDLFAKQGIQYHNVPLIEEVSGPGFDIGMEIFEQLTSMGDFYLMMFRQPNFASKLVKALELIASHRNQPVLFHCAVGKDRTGLLAAALLSVLGVADEVIVDDYHLTAAYMPRFMESIREDVPQGDVMLESLPAYMWEAEKESIRTVLSHINNNYGSFKSYLREGGGTDSLFEKLQSDLLERN